MVYKTLPGKAHERKPKMSGFFSVKKEKEEKKEHKKGSFMKPKAGEKSTHEKAKAFAKPSKGGKTTTKEHIKKFGSVKKKEQSHREKQKESLDKIPKAMRPYHY